MNEHHKGANGMPLPENRNKPADRSTRHHVVDSRFAAILTQDFGIETVVIKILAWAERTGDPARALVAWARKHNKGRCRRAARPADRPQRRHGSPGGNRPGDGRGSGPARTGGIDPAFVRANLEKMEG
jgi:hypothetical protein